MKKTSTNFLKKTHMFLKHLVQILISQYSTLYYSLRMFGEKSDIKLFVVQFTYLGLVQPILWLFTVPAVR